MASDKLFCGNSVRRTARSPSRLRRSQRIDVFFTGDRKQRAVLGRTHEDREVLHQWAKVTELFVARSRELQELVDRVRPQCVDRELGRTTNSKNDLAVKVFEARSSTQNVIAGGREGKCKN